MSANVPQQMRLGTPRRSRPQPPRSRMGTIAAHAIVGVLVLLAACAPTTGGTAPPGAGATAGGQDAAATDAAPAESPASTTTGGGTGTLDFLWFTDGPDLEVMEELVARFSEEQGVDVNFLNIPYADLNQRLRAQIAGGDPPDLVRLTDLGIFGQSLLDLRPHLSDPESFTSQFLEQPMGYATGPDGEVHGIPHDFTMNGPFVNVDMFTAADIDIPGADDEPWTWDELVENATAAQEAAGAPYAIAFDRSGHRFGGMLHQFGGRYFTESDDIAFSSEGAQEAVSRFVTMHEEELMPLDVWLGSGSAYADAADFFISQQVPVYFAGNWLVGHFNDTITDFEWAAMPNPCAENCGGFPGGKFVAALQGGDNPEAAAALIEFLASREVMEEYVTRSLFLPTRNDLIEEGLEYPARTSDMSVFLADIPRLAESTYNDVYNPAFGPIAGLAADQITAVLAGETDVEGAMQLTREEGEQLLTEMRGE